MTPAPSGQGGGILRKVLLQCTDIQISTYLRLRYYKNRPRKWGVHKIKHNKKYKERIHVNKFVSKENKPDHDQRCRSYCTHGATCFKPIPGLPIHNINRDHASHGASCQIRRRKGMSRRVESALIWQEYVYQAVLSLRMASDSKHAGGSKYCNTISDPD